MPRRLYLVLLSMHLAVIAFYSAAGCMAGPPAMQPAWVHYLLSRPALKWPGLVCGSATGYGFFAPQVGSSFLLQFKLYDRHGTLITTVRNPGLKSPGGLLRYTNFLHRFQDLAPRKTGYNQPSKKRQRLLKATAQSMSRQIAMTYKSVDHVLVSILAYQPRTLHADGHQQNGPIFLIYEETIHCRP